MNEEFNQASLHSTHVRWAAVAARCCNDVDFAVKRHTAAGAGDKCPPRVVPLFKVPALEKSKKEVVQHIRQEDQS